MADAVKPADEAVRLASNVALPTVTPATLRSMLRTPFVLLIVPLTLLTLMSAPDAADAPVAPFFAMDTNQFLLSVYVMAALIVVPEVPSVTDADKVPVALDAMIFSEPRDVPLTVRSSPAKVAWIPADDTAAVPV